MMCLSRNNIKPIALMLIFLMWILFALNYYNVDYHNYKAAYESIGNGISSDYFEIGFLLLIRFFNLLNFSYQGFLIVIATVTLFIFYKGISYITKNTAIVLLLFFIYPFILDIVQYRNFLGFAICLYGLHYILKEEVNKEDIIKYILLVLLAMQIHKSMIIYLFLLILLIKNNKTIISLSIILFIGILFFVYFNNIFLYVLRLVGLESFIRYEVDYNYSTFIQFSLLYVFYLILGIIKYKNNYNSKLFRFLIVSIIFLPFIILNGNSSRFFRNILVVIYCVFFQNSFSIYRKAKSIDIIIMILVIIAPIAVFYVQLMNGFYFYDVVLPIFKSNLLWKNA